MLDPTQMPPRMFDLTGTFLGFVGGNSRKPKSVVLKVEDEQIVIKLPKELRPSITQSVTAGDRLRCIGSSQVDFKAGVIKLKAYQVFFLGSSEDGPEAPPDPALTTAVELSLRQQEAVNIAPKQKSAQILVCHKSGCQKRGGRKMVTALEQVLQKYQLQDQVEIRYTGCQKRCSKAPNLTIMPGKHRYDNLNPHDISALIEEHFCSS
ncbi:(2Fe-2S) ferredoxin domain-containing protein [Nodosilinea sp. LEGE 07088]|uniref:(2Fe-2S) ferredoxin domain-containing protein n=1 Tax=Nodosilinea sp. LEGE 07088 TaxID=2777968 RepID=UPI0018825980|nr:(2Fe-2S) ferredoxin domain-containing protein [Nodosilinea sp. LEGE 07088]MBE9140995.1 (2Fe-2S) ferredoxin domain-containing protein [Nodosilinea sp. LEGE 07088]